MRVIIRIGTENFLLPSDKGVASLMSTLSKSVPIEGYYGSWSDRVQISHSKYRSEIRMEYVPDWVVVIDPTPKADKPSAPRQLIPAQRLLLTEG